MAVAECAAKNMVPSVIGAEVLREGGLLASWLN
jgi:hypothetical protein